jgi:hypothetical protein
MLGSRKNRLRRKLRVLDGRLVWTTGEQRVLEALVPPQQSGAPRRRVGERRFRKPKSVTRNLCERLLNHSVRALDGLCGVERAVQRPMNALCSTMDAPCERWSALRQL